MNCRTVVGKLTTKHKEAETGHKYYEAFKIVDYQLQWLSNKNRDNKLQEEL